MGKILVIEDDSSIRRAVEGILHREGYSVVSAKCGLEALEAVSGGIDLVILDVMLPDMDGFTLCSAIRERGFTMPVLMLTVLDAVEHKVRGLESGADDYLTKPFSYKELVARVRALIRRYRQFKSVLKVADLELDPVSRKVTRGGKVIELSPKEFEILQLLVENKGRVIGERAIMKRIWGMEKGNVLKVYICHIRRKIDADFDKKLLKTVRGVGYVIDET